jgi:hypothetical protein
MHKSFILNIWRIILQKEFSSDADTGNSEKPVECKVKMVYTSHKPYILYEKMSSLKLKYPQCASFAL